MLTETKDEDLVKQIQEGDDNSSSAIKELINRHSGIYLDTIHCCVPQTSRETNKEDLLDDKDYNIYKFILDYDHSKRSKFSTYLCDRTKWMCYNLYNKNAKNKIISTEEIETDVKDVSDDIQSLIKREQLQKVLNHIQSSSDPRVEKIFKLRYIEGVKNKTMPWGTISEHVGMSIQGCINIHNKTISEVKKVLTDKKNLLI